ncbi:hypothetical protein PsYK624_170340 [Phanerochaete sordida]|uniref:Uncharacterized protein n=1 Tax=Phanerochaete sordida TaxID=48140 RepID=A0A9P3GT37_9APHY|nr:hypothetical protein PsYK624_170340 [Phanerochaete sordida]
MVTTTAPKVPGGGDCTCVVVCPVHDVSIVSQAAEFHDFCHCDHADDAMPPLETYTEEPDDDDDAAGEAFCNVDDEVLSAFSGMTFGAGSTTAVPTASSSSTAGVFTVPPAAATPAPRATAAPARRTAAAPAPTPPAAPAAAAPVAPGAAPAGPTLADFILWLRAHGVIRDGELTVLDSVPRDILIAHQSAVYLMGYGRDPKQPALGPCAAVLGGWTQCARMVNKVSGAAHRKVSTVTEAFQLWKEACNNGNFDELTIHPESIFPRLVTRAELARRQAAAGLPPLEPPPATAPTPAPAVPAPVPVTTTGPAPAAGAGTPLFYVVLKGARPGLYYTRAGFRAGRGTNPMAVGLVFSSEDEAETWWMANSGTSEIVE